MGCSIYGENRSGHKTNAVFEPGNPASTCYNATLLHAVMGNLLRNALHYTERGFIRLTLTSTGFTVEDSGVGIPEEKREAMFEPFVRSNEKRGEGLGLGLSLVQRICENQGWECQPDEHGAQWLPFSGGVESARRMISLVALGHCCPPVKPRNTSGFYTTIFFTKA